MQWRPVPGAGFTTGRPWLRIAPDADRRNVELESRDPDSVLAVYRRLLAFRATSPALRRGSMTRLESGDGDVLAWTRDDADERLVVIVNFAGEPRSIVASPLTDGAWTARVGTHRELPGVPAGGRVDLRPDEAVVFRQADR
jgi:alpha-glucosidase